MPDRLLVWVLETGNGFARKNAKFELRRRGVSYTDIMQAESMAESRRTMWE
jgi:hypothetical protein